MEKSINFYRDIIGLPVARRFMSKEGLDICFLGGGETKVELICRPTQSAPCGVGVALGFEVKSVDATLKFVKDNGLSVDSGPFQPNPHIKFFFVKDPDGYTVQFVENI